MNSKKEYLDISNLEISSGIRALGVCFGSSNLKVVELLYKNGKISIGKKLIRPYLKNLTHTYEDLIQELKIDSYDYSILTGRKFKEKINAVSISEPEAIENALSYLHDMGALSGNFSALVSLGAENILAYHLDANQKIHKIETENKCASGTGEFFLQQIGRLNIELEEAIGLAINSDPYKISGRCSVYCKSDCTHALNDGVPVGKVISGLSRMVAEKVLVLLDKVEDGAVFAIGGLTKNSAIMKFLKESVTNLHIPEESDIFEALGAAYYALRNRMRLNIDKSHLTRDMHTSFKVLPPISNAANLVTFKEMKTASAEKGDECVIGIDVGSTTTKAVVFRLRDNSVLASVYLRTNGDPVKAARKCYAELDLQIKEKIVISGLAVTGSGRTIVGLHAGTDAIINEIIAHAAGSAYFDKDTDTIFEIGGQDAKYIYLTNSVPTDYAMNEACSAGTGSFLEEAVKNNFSIDYTDIEKIALADMYPLGFNDQCSAFISSDIKTAMQDDIPKNDIIAGLVYSICMNYLNRVKAQRAVGKKVFMQGGVCYNKAVPLAMANLIQKEIIVPPEPGLVGAFGLALELKDRLDKGCVDKKSFNLKDLALREIEYGKSFVCKGESKCDRNCRVNILIINDKKFPFGGACNKYYNEVHHISSTVSELDYVNLRSDLMFGKYAVPVQNKKTARIGINRSFEMHLLYPLFFNFFEHLGFEVVLADEIDPEGLSYKNAAFCYPVEIAHGYFYNLLQKNLDYIVLPRFVELSVDNSVSLRKEHQSSCLILHSEPYVLKSAFKDKIKNIEILMPEFNFYRGWDSQEDVFIETAVLLGKTSDEARAAHAFALSNLRDFRSEIKEIGKKILNDLEENDKTAIVLMGRPYNAMSKDANLGIPGKFSSRGFSIIPWDFLEIENEYCQEDMSWATGQDLIRASHFIYKNPRLFGVFVTNFSCGPDSILLTYFRDIMKTKPSLTLEIDSHTADAGINTRVEAFLDIVDRYKKSKISDEKEEFVPAKIEYENGRAYFISSDSNRYDLFKGEVKVLIPSMGVFGSDMLADALRSAGLDTVTMPAYDKEDLMLGRENTLGKECLPLILVVGGMMRYLKYHFKEGDHVVIFMPTGAGNCRYPQYSGFMNNLINRKKIRNVALLSLTPENSFAGVPTDGMLSFLKGIIISDVMEDIKNALRVLAKDWDHANKVIDDEWEKIRTVMRTRGAKGIYKALKKTSKRLNTIPLKFPLSRAKKVALMGDIFARRDDFCCQDLVETLSSRDMVVKRDHVYGFLNYFDYMVSEKVYDSEFSLRGWVEFYAKRFLQTMYEARIKKILARSGLYETELVNMKSVFDYSRQFFSLHFTGEQGVLVGTFYREILHSIHGAISLGPFACMPVKVAEAILEKEATLEVKQILENTNYGNSFGDIIHLPFLAIETDGNPFPQIVQAKIESFCLQVERVYKQVGKNK